MRIPGAKRQHFAGWAGGVWEDSEPDLSGDSAVGVLQEAMNTVSTPGGRRAVRHGTRVVQTFSAVSGDDISDVVGIFRWSQTGAIAIAHSEEAEKHFAYALDTGAQFALPVGSVTESGSRVDAEWDGTTPGRPLGVELFETLYVVDTTLNSGNRQPMIALKLDTGALVASVPTYDLDASGGSPGPIFPVCAAVYNGVLFVAGYDSETGGFQPHLLRHSWLGRNPAAADGFHYLAYAVIGALNEPIMALSPGSSLLLVAKENELYRVSGQGKGIEGWQYAIAQVDNSLGFGCSSPYAVAHVNGMWYGVGSGGPWRSDGARVESLLPGRNRSWAAIDNLALAFVRPHPDRRRIVFGFHRAGESDYPIAPYRFWLWDIERERWDSDWQSGTTRSYHVIEPIPGSVVVPDTAPLSLAQSFEDGEFMAWIGPVLGTTTHYRQVWGTFTPGDTSAETEVWVRFKDSDSYGLNQTLPAGVRRFQVLAPVPGELYHGPYTIRVRHKKAGNYSNYSAEVLFYPPLIPPDFRAWFNPTVSSGAWVSVFRNVPFDVRAVSTPAHLNKTWTENPPAGLEFAGNPSPFQLTDYQAWHETAEWPVGHQQSILTECQALSNNTLLPDKHVSAARQIFWSGNISTQRAVVLWSVMDKEIDYELEFRLAGSSDSWVVADTRQNEPMPAFNVPFFSLIGTVGSPLTPGTKYEMRVRNTVSGVVSATTYFYTALPEPSVTSIVATGTPEVTLTLSIPQDGHDVRIYNADKSYDVTEANVSSGPLVKVSTEGSCGVPDRYFIRTYDSDWPAGFQYSNVVIADIASPCT